MAQTWLPRSAMQDGALCAAVGKALQRWSSDWLASDAAPTVEVARMADDTEVASRTGVWSSKCDKLSLYFELDTPSRLGRLLTKVSADRVLADEDELLLRDLSASALASLTATLSAFFQLAPDPRYRSDSYIAGKALAFRVHFRPGWPDLQLIVDEGCAIEARKRLVHQRAETAPLADRESSIAQQVIPIGAQFNSTTIPMTAFKTLSCGDVIVLDHHCDRQLALTVNRRAQSIACDIVAEADGLSLHIAHA
jgi:hypothetical protein